MWQIKDTKDGGFEIKKMDLEAIIKQIRNKDPREDIEIFVKNCRERVRQGCMNQWELDEIIEDAKSLSPDEFWHKNLM